MKYNRCGRSGLLLPEISLGLWHNFSNEIDSYENARKIVLEAYENGITQFDLANNYGPPPGAAELTFGRILKEDLAAHRNKIVITTKAGHLMWEGVYGDWGSRKHLITSCDESLVRMGVDYVDIFYSHRYDPQTPLEETMSALDTIVRSGRALYVGLSKYPASKMREALDILRELKTPVIVDQLRYSLLDREAEQEHFALHREYGLGCVSFSPLAQGQLSEKYLRGIPADSRAAKAHGFLQVEQVLENIEKVRNLKKIADNRGQSLSQMAIAWQLANPAITSVIVGVSSVEQLRENLAAAENTNFREDELC
ncbi:Putative ion-channel protein [Mucinivorans hirudinis]|uniref:Putative ion-channel protein n=1 Tax=Mucinivorans hirudinis TaxID=1433126 RepID=A0A060R6Y5_9BACT|nr:Putative ion-channel protein [Mucinivorans hirudinis]